MKKINKGDIIFLQYAFINNNKLITNSFCGLCIKNNKNKNITLKTKTKKINIFFSFLIQSPIILYINKINLKLYNKKKKSIY